MRVPVILIHQMFTKQLPYVRWNSKWNVKRNSVPSDPFISLVNTSVIEIKGNTDFSKK